MDPETPLTAQHSASRASFCFFNAVTLTEDASEETQPNGRSVLWRSWRSEANSIKQVNPRGSLLLLLPTSQSDPETLSCRQRPTSFEEFRLLFLLEISLKTSFFCNPSAAYWLNLYHNCLLQCLTVKILPLFKFHAVLHYNRKRQR